jgi:hypothetical protein
MRRGLRAASRTKQDFALQSIASPRNQSNRCITIIGRFRKVPLSPNRNRLQFTGQSQWPHLRANPASLGRKPVPQPDCLRGVWFPSWPVRRHSSSSGSKRHAYSIEAAAVLGIHPKTLQRGFARLNWPTSTIRMQGAAGPDQRKVQKRIVRPAARGNAGSGRCQRKHRHNPAKIVPSFALKQIPVQ